MTPDQGARVLPAKRARPGQAGVRGVGGAGRVRRTGWTTNMVFSRA
ncbi:MAG: hypothetical protein QOI21_2952, partial [Actinomycetota bacterium]|nr:hypothetical protein [Actinomycetota bacterium]